MLHSMTGFARQTVDTPLGTLSCEIRAVNHRYLDVQFRMPDELRARETELRARIGRTVSRGKLDCSLYFRRATAAGRLAIDRDLVALLGERAAEVQALLPGTRLPDALDVLRWPGVVEEPPVDVEPLYEAGCALLDDTLAALDTMRASEGQRIAGMLDTRCGEMLGIAQGVRERLPEVLEGVQRKQRERLARLDVEADPGRLETELALIAQKLDVDEELDRLASHVEEIRLNLASGEPVGRRLDFLMQELNREANTLGSKSADAATTRAAVELKVLIEQMREQVQNVE
ncbi:MAG: YicC/YloC family endoribonuclease [Woeseiaceae bacterium]|nr:YicC/YloC family endoribonuclease [Woeseiaceae bacterium]